MTSTSLIMHDDLGLNDYDIVEIAADGNVVLVLPSDPDKRVVRVHSRVLKLASTVFRVMFGLHFKEAQSFNEQDLKVGSLTHDDAEAMVVICRLLHLQDIQTITHPPQQKKTMETIEAMALTVSLKPRPI
ncbi:hypothetical protein SLS57_005513 [Botryosphaeria dothidea]